MKALVTPHPLPVIVFAGPSYWRDPNETRHAFESIAGHLRANLKTPFLFHLIASEKDLRMLVAEQKYSVAALLPMSGAVQPWMIEYAQTLRHGAILNAYLPGMLPVELGALLMERNAHPSCTDFFAHRRLTGKVIRWIDSMDALGAFAAAHQAVSRLRTARILRIGETEPWVINSTRDPERFREALGCEVVPLEKETLYTIFNATSGTDALSTAKDWSGRADEKNGIGEADIVKASRVFVAMRKLLDEYKADALSMACFSMIGELDTTSCVALSALNDSVSAIGACEGDLDAAVTLFLLKALGADFVWIANPIIHPDNWIDLAHCTAPRSACGHVLKYRLMRHHESGRGVAPEVSLTADRDVTLARIGANLTQLCVHPGYAQSIAKQPTCHTQIRVTVPSTRHVVDSLLGTHLIMSYGDFRPELSHCAYLLGLSLTGTPSSLEIPDNDGISPLQPTPIPFCACSVGHKS